MDRLTKALEPYGHIGLDTSIFIFYNEISKEYTACAQYIFQGIEDGRWIGHTSIITLTELLVLPLREKKMRLARTYEALLSTYPNLFFHDIDRDIARIAATLRTEYGIRTPDSLQVASCINNEINVFLTNDKRLSKLSDVIDIIVFSEICKSL